MHRPISSIRTPTPYRSFPSFGRSCRDAPAMPLFLPRQPSHLPCLFLPQLQRRFQPLTRPSQLSPQVPHLLSIPQPSAPQPHLVVTTTVTTALPAHLQWRVANLSLSVSPTFPIPPPSAMRGLSKIFS